MSSFSYAQYDSATRQQNPVKVDEAANADGGVTDGNKGDITVSNSGATWALNAKSVGDAEIADRTPNTFPITGPDSRPLSITASQLNALLPTVTETVKGLVPPTGTPTFYKYLRDDAIFANPLQEAGGANLVLGAIDDGDVLVREEDEIKGRAAAILGTYVYASRPSAAGLTGLAIRVTGLGNVTSVWQESDGSRWRMVNGIALIYHNMTPGTEITIATTDTFQTIAPSGGAVVIPGGLLGPHSLLRIIPHVRYNTNSPSPTSNNRLQTYFGGQLIADVTQTWHDQGGVYRIGNADATNAQTRYGSGNGGTGYGTNNASIFKPATAIDTTVDKNITFQVTGNSGAPFIMMSLTVEIIDP